jgi:hypothetical protein
MLCEQGSLIKLLKGNKLMTEEWRDANKHNDIIEALKDAQIVSEEQATRIIALVTDAMFPAVVSQVILVYQLHAYKKDIQC